MSEDIYEKIKTGYYQTVEPQKRLKKNCFSCGVWLGSPIPNFCRECGATFADKFCEIEKEWKEQRKIEIVKEREVFDKFVVDAIEYCGLKDHPKARAAFDRAWESEHPHGYVSVVEELEELADLLI